MRGASLHEFMRLRNDSTALVPLISIVAGEVATGSKPTALRTVLGSCVSVCLFDSAIKIGGMNHILLHSTTTQEQTARVGVHAMELLINSMMKLGGLRHRFVAKCFGGANVVPCFHSPTVGERNIEFVRAFLATESIPVAAECLGGVRAMQVHFRVDTGRVIVRRIAGSPLRELVQQEQAFVPRLQPGAGDITLF